MSTFKKPNNAYLHHYYNNINALITDHNHICVLLETASRYEMQYAIDQTEHLVQDFLNEIVLALFDTHFKQNNVDEKYSKIMKMFQQSFANAESFYEDDESESA